MDTDIQVTRNWMREKKKNLESRIAKLVAEFSRETGLTVEEIVLNFSSGKHGEGIENYYIYAQIAIDQDYVGD